MKGKSHRLLAHYLIEQYLARQPRRRAWAFLLGCVQPDKNPATYLKGSIREQWLRGHNWDNSQRYMQRLCRRLERKQKLGMLSCYNLGKLVHYTADAFTFAHNGEFPEDLKAHNAYEQALQAYFLSHFQELTGRTAAPSGTVMDTIRSYHRDYAREPFHFRADASYTVAVCCCILCMLVP